MKIKLIKFLIDVLARIKSIDVKFSIHLNILNARILFGLIGRTDKQGLFVDLYILNFFMQIQVFEHSSIAHGLQHYFADLFKMKDLQPTTEEYQSHMPEGFANIAELLKSLGFENPVEGTEYSEAKIDKPDEKK